jgi:hypothetical protein
VQQQDVLSTNKVLDGTVGLLLELTGSTSLEPLPYWFWARFGRGLKN